MKKYGTDPKLDKLVDSNNWEDRIKAAEQDYGLDKLVNDENEYVRKEVVKHGYKLDKLINDKSWCVRAAVAKQGYRIDKLVNDEDEDVRKAVAEQGYGLDKLVYDENWYVRYLVKKYLEEHNYKSIFDWAKDNNVDLNINEWLNSNDFRKREPVAKAGYRLDKLVNDKNRDIRFAVYDYLKEHNYKSVFDWAKDNNIDIDIDEWLNSDNWAKRKQVAEQGYKLDILINDYNYNVRRAVAEQGYGLDKLIYDKDENVREAVAEQGYGLDKLVYDEEYYVREAVAKQGYRLDKLINDENKDVRKLVDKYLKEHNYKSVFNWAKDNNIDIDLDEWLNSDCWRKRYAVAEQGYRLDKLIFDEDGDVRAVVYSYLKEHNLTIEEWCEQTGHKLKNHKKINTKSCTSIIIEINEEDSDGVRTCHDIYKRDFWSFINGSHELRPYSDDIKFYIDHETEHGIYLVLEATDEICENRFLLDLLYNCEGHSAFSAYLDRYYDFVADEGEHLYVDASDDWEPI